MKEYVSVFNTDQINKYGYRFSIGALESGLSQAWEIGTPMFISHDYHRPLGWSKPLGLRVLSDQVELIGLSMFAENQEEQEKINNLSSLYISRKIQAVDQSDRDSLTRGIERHLTGNEVFAIRECISLIDEDIARKVLPELFKGDEKDKRNLCALKDLKAIAPGVFEYKGRAVFAHRFFRRSLSQFNNLNFSFLKHLNDLCRSEDLDVKISLDPHSIGLLESYSEPIELDYWWGPKFDNSLQSIPAGVTRHEQSERARFFSGISGTEFWWHMQNGIQSLECEELRETPSFGVGGEEYGCRYIHSMVSDTGIPYHLDGAIRLYNEEAYINRLDASISNAGKNSNYFKLWRIDGDIPVSLWKELISDFYRDNHLIGEYFDGADNQSGNSSDPLVNEAKDDPLFQYVSRARPSDRAQIFVSYHPLDTFPGELDVEVVPVDFVVVDDQRFNVIEFEAVDLLKGVRQALGMDCPIPSHVKYIAYEDFDINFPLFVCRGSDAVSNANKIFQCIRSVSLDQLGVEERVITASVCVTYAEAVVKYSIASSIESLSDLLFADQFSIPISFSGVAEWAQTQNNALDLSLSERGRTPPDRSMLKSIGDFRVSRKFADRDKIRFDKDGGITYLVHEAESALMSLILERRCLFLTPVIFIYKAQCTCCGGDYLACECLAVFRGSGVRVEEAKILGAVWSSRNLWSNKNGSSV